MRQKIQRHLDIDNKENLKQAEVQYQKNSDSLSNKFAYGKALIQTANTTNQEKGVTILEGIIDLTEEDQSEAIAYWIAVGQYRLKNYQDCIEWAKKIPANSSLASESATIQEIAQEALGSSSKKGEAGKTPVKRNKSFKNFKKATNNVSKTVTGLVKQAKNQKEKDKEKEKKDNTNSMNNSGGAVNAKIQTTAKTNTAVVASEEKEKEKVPPLPARSTSPPAKRSMSSSQKGTSDVPKLPIRDRKVSQDQALSAREVRSEIKHNNNVSPTGDEAVTPKSVGELIRGGFNPLVPRPGGPGGGLPPRPPREEGTGGVTTGSVAYKGAAPIMVLPMLPGKENNSAMPSKLVQEKPTNELPKENLVTDESTGITYSAAPRLETAKRAVGPKGRRPPGNRPAVTPDTGKAQEPAKPKDTPKQEPIKPKDERALPPRPPREPGISPVGVKQELVKPKETPKTKDVFGGALPPRPPRETPKQEPVKKSHSSSSSSSDSSDKKHRQEEVVIPAPKSNPSKTISPNTSPLIRPNMGFTAEKNRENSNPRRAVPRKVSPSHSSKSSSSSQEEPDRQSPEKRLPSKPQPDHSSEEPHHQSQEKRPKSQSDHSLDPEHSFNCALCKKQHSLDEMRKIGPKTFCNVCYIRIMNAQKERQYRTQKSNPNDDQKSPQQHSEPQQNKPISQSAPYIEPVSPSVEEPKQGNTPTLRKASTNEDRRPAPRKISQGATAQLHVRKASQGASPVRKTSQGYNDDHGTAGPLHVRKTSQGSSPHIEEKRNTVQRRSDSSSSSSSDDNRQRREVSPPKPEKEPEEVFNCALCKRQCGIHEQKKLGPKLLCVTCCIRVLKAQKERKLQLQKNQEEEKSNKQKNESSSSSSSSS
jgi:hypothetical protein